VSVTTDESYFALDGWGWCGSAQGKGDLPRRWCAGLFRFSLPTVAVYLARSLGPLATRSAVPTVNAN